MINSVIHGDCLEEMSKIPDKSIDMILCDLPYGTTRNKWDSIIPLDLLWNQYERIIKDNGAIVLTAQTPFDKVLGVSNLKLLKYEWVWRKNRGTGHLNAKRMPMKNHENALVFYKKPPVYNRQMREGDSYSRKSGKGSTNYGEQVLVETNNKGRYPLSVLDFPVVEKTIHPTQKPVGLFEYFLKTYTNPGMTVLDNCAGSGTTAIAAMNTGRNYILIEKEKEYIDIINERITEHTSQLSEV